MNHYNQTPGEWILDLPVKIKKTSRHMAQNTLESSRLLFWKTFRPKAIKPVIIAGCSRAGTTITHHTFGRSRHLSTLNVETRYLWQELFNPENRGWISDAAGPQDLTRELQDRIEGFYYMKHGGRQRWVDKTCINSFKLPLFLKLWPDMSVIYLHRDGRDNINSLINGWRKHTQFHIYDLPKDTNLRGIPNRTWCFFLQPDWQEVLGTSVEEVCAHQWIAANQAILDAKPLFRTDRWIEMRYEDLFKRPVEMFSEAFQKLDIPFDENMKSHCREIINNPVSLISSAPKQSKWKRENPEAIEKILPAIMPMMQKLGYQV